MDLPWVFSAFSANCRATVMICARGTPVTCFGPGRRVGHVVVVAAGDIAAAEAAIDAVVGGEQVEHRRHRHLAGEGLHAAHRHVARQHVVMRGGAERSRCPAAEIGKRHRNDFVVPIGQGQRQRRRGAGARVASAPGSTCRRRPSGSRSSRSAPPPCHRPDRNRASSTRPASPGPARRPDRRRAGSGRARTPVARLQHHQHRHVGQPPAIIGEIRRSAGRGGIPSAPHAPIAMRQRRVGALLRVQPEVGELRGLGIIRARSPPIWSPL